MRPNPALRKLGFADSDRVAIIHADDIGMCQATLTAFAELLDFGLVSCGAAMTPCPWFPSVAAYAATHPGADIGVHLTLNCEYSTYRWGALSTRDPATGLLDADGCFFRLPTDTQRHADPAAVRTELEAQVALALAAGIDVSHVDTHMGTRRASQVRRRLCRSGACPPPAADDHALRRGGLARAQGLDAETAAISAAMVEQLEASGVPLVDEIVGMPLDAPDERIARAKAMFDALPPGITHFVIHPAADTPELRAIATGDWPSRVGDHRTFMSEELRDYVRKSGVQVIGYRALRDLMRA